MKKTNLAFLGLGLFLLLAITIPANAVMFNAADTLIMANDEPLDTALTDTVLRDSVSYTGEGPGYTLYFRPGIRFGSDRVIGYYDLLVPLYFTDKSVLFFNPKVSFDDREGYEWNLGLGYRHMLLDDKLIIGGNIFWDWRKSSTGEQYQQLGLGLELMTELGFTGINARVNGYISLSDEEILEQWREYYFTSTSLAYSWAYRVEEPLSGIDYEAGFRIPYLSDYVETWVYAGGYNYWADYSDDINGFMARLEIIPTDFIKASYEYRNDNVRGDEHYGEFTVTLPFSIENLIAGKNPFEGLGSRIGGSRDMTERLYEQVRRDVDIVLETTDITRKTHLDDVLPGDSNYQGMVYVDNSNTGFENGTLEHPWDTIAEGLADPRVPNDWVFVFKGNSATTPYAGGFALPAGITLWGQGTDPYGIGFSLIHPVVNGTGLRNVFDIDFDYVTVMGFEITNANDGIEANDVSGCVIKSNIIHDITSITNEDGIGISFWSGGTVLRNNVISNNIIYNTERMGICLGGIAGGDVALAEGNIISNNTIYETGSIPLVVSKADDTTISGNKIYYNIMGTVLGGICVFDSLNNIVTRNDVTKTTVGIYFRYWPTIAHRTTFGPHYVNYNNIYGNDCGIRNYNINATINATNNWWGGPGGPGVGGNNGVIDDVGGTIITSPWSDTQF